VGMVLAAMLFMKRMIEVTNVGALREEMDDSASGAADPGAIALRDVPAGIEVFEINGPFFFGVADRIKDTLKGLEKPPKVFILRMRRVNAVDATACTRWTSSMTSAASRARCSCWPAFTRSR
jgi:SulP family sulfate permease